MAARVAYADLTFDQRLELPGAPGADSIYAHYVYVEPKKVENGPSGIELFFDEVALEDFGDGGMNISNCSIVLPDLRRFDCLIFRGDTATRSAVIRAKAAEYSFDFGFIDGEWFVTSNSERFPLAECFVDFALDW